MFLLIYSLSGASDTHEDIFRPKIGLVLGGGGARGAAHIGVLKVLEENNVPVDFIVGTSMGAIIGGLYASGLSPEELERLMSDTDWPDLFSDRIPEEFLPLRLKGTEQRLIDFEIGVKHGKLALPRGVVAGQKLGFMLEKLTMHVWDLKSFDDLGVPFRAISADLATGEEIVHDKGDLSEAMRASMSIPGVFPPVEMEGRILVDGGIVDNLPVDIAKKMGADIIIAVDVGTPLDKIEKLHSLVTISMQVVGILTRQNVQRSIAELSQKDILIRPQLSDIKAESFTRTPEAVILGEEAARKAVGKIKRYSISEKAYQEYLAHQRARHEEPLVIDFVKVKKPTRVSEETIKQSIKTKPGEPLNLTKLQNDLTRIYALGDFESVNFEVAERDKKKGLLIDAVEKSWGPNYLRFGLNFSSDSEGDSEYTLLSEIRLTRLNKLGAESRTLLEFGETTGVFSEWYQPLDFRNYFFIDPYGFYKRDLTEAYNGNTRIAEYRVELSGGGLDLGVNFSSLAEGRVGLRRMTVNAKPRIGGDYLPVFNDMQSAELFGSLIYDQFDNHSFPKKGIVAGSIFSSFQKILGGDLRYEKLDFFAHKASTFHKRHTLIGSFEGGLSINEETPYFDEFSLGGFLSLSGYDENQLTGQHRGLGRLVYFYRLTSFPLVKGVYLGSSFEAGNIWNRYRDIKPAELIFGGSVFVGLDSFLGPLYIAYGQAKKSNGGRVYVFLGKKF
jgi:NTE family protein